jgi:hypothetical protein
MTKKKAEEENLHKDRTIIVMWVSEKRDFGVWIE